MILMRMGQNKPAQIFDTLLNKGRIRHDHINARGSLITKGDATIHHQPFFIMSIQVQIHPDLARAAQRQEQELIRTRCVRVAETRRGHTIPPFR